MDAETRKKLRSYTDARRNFDKDFGLGWRHMDVDDDILIDLLDAEAERDRYLSTTAGAAMLRVVEAARKHFNDSGYCPDNNNYNNCRNCIWEKCERRELGIALGALDGETHA
jgi:hypothetical protein